MDRDLRIRMLLEASDRVTRPLRDMAGGSTRLGQAVRATRDRLKELERAQADIAGFRALKTGMAATSTAMQAAQARATALGREMAQTATPTRAMSREFAKAKAEAEKLTRQHETETRQLQQLRERLRAAGVSTSDLARHERELRERTAGTNRELQEQTRRLETVAARERRMGAARERFGRIQGMAGNVAAGGAASIAAGAALGAPVAGAAKQAMNLEEAMAGVSKVTGLADDRLRAMTTRIVDLSTKIPMTAPELANIAAAAGAAGVGMDKFGRALPTQAEDLVAFTDAAARMGIAFDMTAEDAGGTMAKWRQAFKMTQGEVEGLGDRINALTNKYGGNAAAVAGIVTRIGPLGKVAGVAASEITALASSLNSIGLEEEIAATGIKNTMLALTKGTAATKDQRKAFAALGLDAEKVSKAMQVDGKKTIVDVFERIGRLTPDKQASMLSELFGSESVAAIAPLLTNLDGLKQRLGLVGDSSQYAGSMTNEFLARINTTKGATDLAANAFQATNIALGQALLPTVKAAAMRFGAMALRVRAWAARHPELSRNLMIGAGALAFLLFVLGGFGILAAAIMGPIAMMNFGLIALGVAGGTASLGLLPIIGIIAAVVLIGAALAAIAYIIYSKWGAISDFFGKLWTGVKSAFSAAGTAISATMRRLWEGLTAGVTAGGNRIAAFFGGIWDRVKAVFSMSLGDILNRLSGFVGYALGTLFRFSDNIRSWITGTLPGLLLNGWNTAWGLLVGGIGASFTWLTTTLPAMLRSGWNAAWAMLTGAIGASATWLSTTLPGMLSRGWGMAWGAFKGAMRAAFVTLPAMFFDFGAMIIQGLWNGIKSAPGRLLAAGKNMAASLSGGFRKGADINSPSRVFMALGGHIIGGLTLGLDRRQGEAVGRMTRLTRRMAAAATMPAIAMGTIATPALALDEAEGVARRSAAIRITTAGDAAAGAMRAPDAPGSRGASAPGFAPAPAPITINVYGAAGQSEEALATAVERALDRAQARQLSASRSSFADRPDGADL